MTSMVDNQNRMAEALRVLVGYAVRDMPEWASQDALDARHRAITEASFVLSEYDAAEPAVVAMPHRVVLRERTDAPLALAS